MSDADKKWIPQSDDQFWYWDWCIRQGIEPNVSYGVHSATRGGSTTKEYPCATAPTGHEHHRVALINGMGPFDVALRDLVKSLKEAA